MSNRSAYRTLLLMTRRLFSMKIDYSNVPVIEEKELNEDFVRGSGPGGQSVNKTMNCVVLKHFPSGIVVKCHESRSLPQNRKLARKHLISKLDDHINGEMSVLNQKKKIAESNSIQKKAKTKKRLEMKSEFKRREGLD